MAHTGSYAITTDVQSVIWAISDPIVNKTDYWNIHS